MTIKKPSLSRGRERLTGKLINFVAASLRWHDPDQVVRVVSQGEGDSQPVGSPSSKCLILPFPLLRCQIGKE